MRSIRNLAEKYGGTISIDTEREVLKFAKDNGNGTKGCYVLENGTYTISVRANSHDVIDSCTTEIASTFWIGGGGWYAPSINLHWFPL